MIIQALLLSFLILRDFPWDFWSFKVVLVSTTHFGCKFWFEKYDWNIGKYSKHSCDFLVCLDIIAKFSSTIFTVLCSWNLYEIMQPYIYILKLRSSHVYSLTRLDFLGPDAHSVANLHLFASKGILPPVF